MAELLRGKKAADALNEKTFGIVQELRQKGVTPVLAIVRVGEKADDISYERGAMKRCETVGIGVKNVLMPADVSAEVFYRTLDELNRDPEVHGILLFRPVPVYLDNERARNAIVPEKDVDGCGDASLAGVFANRKTGYAPCTAEAAVQILDCYGIDVSGKNAVVLGRSLVVGRPLAMMLMHRNATVTICHTRTRNMAEITRNADLVFACTGQPEIIGKEYLRPGQTVIDVGISWNEAKGKLVGDVLQEEAEPVVDALTPVPGGVGAVTTAVLVYHTALAAKRSTEEHTR